MSSFSLWVGTRKAQEIQLCGFASPGKAPTPSLALTISPSPASTSCFSVAQLSLPDFNLGTWTSQIANANKELPAAVPLDSRRPRLSLFFASTFIAAGTEQDGAGARQEFGGPGEEWGTWISAS